jgi:hypothetical protein
MFDDDSQRGGDLSWGEPDWQPLINLAPEHLEDFMWMYSTELEDGAVLHAYKHWWTRCYIFLDRTGRAFTYTERGRYRQVDALRLLDEVLAGADREIEPRYLARDDALDDHSAIKWAPSAARHGISQQRARFVLEHRCLHLVEGGSAGEGDREPAVVFLGEDRKGVALELTAVELEDDRLLILTAMPLRDSYRRPYEEAIEWRR